MLTLADNTVTLEKLHYQNCGCMCAYEAADYVQLKPHILSTPVIDDLNSDGVTEEILLPVNYYLDDVVDSDR